MNTTLNMLPEVASFYANRGFSLPFKEDSEIIEGRYEGKLFIPSEYENEVVENLISEGKELEDRTCAIIAEMGYSTVYEAALKAVESFWEDYHRQIEEGGRKSKFTDKEKSKLEALKKEVYKYREMAEKHDLDLEERRKEWKSKFPSTKEFSRYASIMGFNADSEEAEHARLLTPVSVLSKFRILEKEEARVSKIDNDIIIKKDELTGRTIKLKDKNRDEWLDFRPDGQTYLDYEKSVDWRYDSETKTSYQYRDENHEEEKKLLKQFAYLGIDPNTDELMDVAIKLGGYTPLLASDIISRRMESAEIDNEDAFRILMLTEERMQEAAEEGAKRDEWREEVRKTKTLPSFDFDTYNLKFGRQKDIEWPKLGGVYKNAWGCRLRFEAITNLPEEDVAMCMNITCYDDGVKKTNACNDYETLPTKQSYVGARKALFSDCKIRSTKVTGYREKYQEFLNVMVEKLVEQNPYFRSQLIFVNDKRLPFDKTGVQEPWYNALRNHVEFAIRKAEAKAEDAWVSHDYSALYDCYGEEAEVMIHVLFGKIRKEAIEAAKMQREYVNGRMIPEYVVEEECCEF